MKSFYENKVVVITGSSRGIGREAARQALGAGARVVLHGRNAEALEAVRLALGAPDRTLAVAADLARPEGAEALAAIVLGTWNRCDVLINNAGLSMRGAFADLSPVTDRAMVEANFLSAVWVTRAFLPALRQAEGRIVFVSSLAGVRGFPGVSLYSASKMALAALAQSLRAEEGPRVKSSLVHLAFVENDPEKTTLGPDGQPFHHQRRHSLSQAQAARALLTTAVRAPRRRTLTAAGRGLFWTQSFFPGLVDRLVEASGGQLHAVRRSE